MRILIISILSIFLLPKSSSAQLNVGGGSASIAILNDDKSGLNTRFMGLNGFIELPIKTYSLHAGYSYYIPIEPDKDNLPQIEELSVIHFYLGKVFRQGQRFQIPLYVGSGKYDSKGDINFDNWSVAAKLGGRLYISSRIALFTEASANYIIAPNFTYTNAIGIEETSNLNPIKIQLNIGVAYSYLK